MVDESETSPEKPAIGNTAVSNNPTETPAKLKIEVVCKVYLINIQINLSINLLVCVCVCDELGRRFDDFANQNC